MILQVLDPACQQAFLYAVALLGMVLSLRVLNWPDLTVDGSFTLGGSVLATLLTHGYSPWISLAIAGLSGFVAGATTCALNRVIGISKILSGILVMLILYSVNLRIMGRANISLLRVHTLFSRFDAVGIGSVERLLTYLGVALLALVIVSYLLVTRIGLFLRATGDNELMVQELGIQPSWLYLIGLGSSNALVAVSGALVSQSQGFADVTMGTGLIMIGIAGLILGEAIWSLLRRLVLASVHGAIAYRLSAPILGELLAALLGSLAYFLVLTVCLRAGLQPTDLKLATGMLVIFGLGIRRSRMEPATYLRERL